MPQARYSMFVVSPVPGTTRQASDFWANHERGSAYGEYVRLPVRSSHSLATIMGTATQIHTYEDYAELPEGPPYYQLIDGELIMSPSPSTLHQQVVSNLYRALYTFVQDHGGGVVLFAPIDVYLSETEVYQPDVVFIDASRREIVEESRINGAPDLVIEVLSPSTGYYDLTYKKRVYAECDVREYWLVDPNERTVELLQPGEEGTFRQIAQLRDKGMVASHLLEGWQMTLEEVFYIDLFDDEQ